MRRKDREVQSLDEIFDILNRCDTVRYENTIQYAILRKEWNCGKT